MNEDNEVREENSSDTQKGSSPPERSETVDKEVSENNSENTVSEKMDNNESSDSFTSEKPNTSDSSDTVSAVDEIIDAIKKELDSRAETEADSADTETSGRTDTDSEAAETGNNETDTEENSSEVTHTGKTRLKVYDSYDPFDDEEDEEISVYTIASASDLPPYEATIVNRLDNILTCAIITACCALLILFHTLKRE
jgi:hypothetical protein